MRLADFILENIEPVLVEWEAFAQPITLLRKQVHGDLQELPEMGHREHNQTTRES